ncbi:MAG TPA: class II glutamine amidotransferase [Patescibacteria group bacterium]|nr:class II glutamine amidotransferase [Patescibacteria group bacterium]
MARLFGLTSKQPVDLLLTFPPSASHGWGVAWYDEQGKQTVKKDRRSALDPASNQEITVNALTKQCIVHTRIATSGTVSKQNAHPFSYKNYTFAHNGSVHKERLLEKLHAPYNEKFESEPIDSEVYFRLIVQAIEESDPKDGIRRATAFANDDRGSSFLLADGETLYAYCFGIPLYFIRWDLQKPLHMVSKHTGSVIQSDQLRDVLAVIVSSERFTEDNWHALDDGELLIVQENMEYEVVNLV